MLEVDRKQKKWVSEKKSDTLFNKSIRALYSHLQYLSTFYFIFFGNIFWMPGKPKSRRLVYRVRI